MGRSTKTKNNDTNHNNNSNHNKKNSSSEQSLTQFVFGKFGVLALCQLFIIGTYWLLRPLKDAVFSSIVGLSHQPQAKLFSLFIILPLILVYNKLADLLKKDFLFYFVCLLFALNFIVCGYFLNDPVIGLPNTEPSPDRYLGWAIYFSIESFGSIVVAMYWTYVSLLSKTEEAKRGYPFIVTVAQIGAILGPTLSTFSPVIGIPPLFFLSGINVVIVVILLATLLPSLAENPPKKTPNTNNKEEKSNNNNKNNNKKNNNTNKGNKNKKDTKPESSVKDKEGMLAGLTYFKDSYVVGILFIATIYEVIGTILDYQMKVLGKEAYQSPQEFAKFLGNFGQAANLLSLVFSLLGTSWLVNRFGVAQSLLIYPISVGIVILLFWSCPWLWVAFGAMIAVKGLSYALNNPLKEMLYLPTSTSVKVKTKSWIDMFGGRFAKAGGSVVTGFFKHSAHQLMVYGTGISVSFVIVWIFVAYFMGKRYNHLILTKSVIG